MLNKICLQSKLREQSESNKPFNYERNIHLNMILESCLATKTKYEEVFSLEFNSVFDIILMLLNLHNFKNS